MHGGSTSAAKDTSSFFAQRRAVTFCLVGPYSIKQGPNNSILGVPSIGNFASFIPADTPITPHFCACLGHFANIPLGSRRTCTGWVRRVSRWCRSKGHNVGVIVVQAYPQPASRASSLFADSAGVRKPIDVVADSPVLGELRRRVWIVVRQDCFRVADRNTSVDRGTTLELGFD